MRGVRYKQSQGTRRGITTNPPMKSLQRRDFPATGSFIVCKKKNLPSPLSTTSRSASKQSGEVPGPRSCSCTPQFFRAKAKSWLFQDPAHLRVSSAI